MTDAELAALLEKRDESALIRVQETYGLYCLKIASNILGSMEDAEECVSDAMLSLWNAVPPAKPDRLRAYLAKITRNLAVNRLEKLYAARRGGGEADKVIEELAECLPGGDGVEDTLDARELEEAIDRFLRSLPEREGNIFIRRCFFTERITEIAERYGVSAHSVTVQLARTRRKLKHYLIKEGLIDA